MENMKYMKKGLVGPSVKYVSIEKRDRSSTWVMRPSRTSTAWASQTTAATVRE